jgi:hypothetical protein
MIKCAQDLYVQCSSKKECFIFVNRGYYCALHNGVGVPPHTVISEPAYYFPPNYSSLKKLKDLL